MKLMFVGRTHWSSRDKKPFDFPSQQAGRELGYHAARRGHTILISSELKNTLDHWIMEGAKECAREEPTRKVFVEVYYPERFSAPYQEQDPKLNNLIIRRVPHLQLDEKAYQKLIPHIAMLDACDAVIALGGTEKTFVDGHIAAIRETPVFVVPSSGGSAQRLYESLRYSYDTRERGCYLISGTHDQRSRLSNWRRPGAVPLM